MRCEWLYNLEPIGKDVYPRGILQGQGAEMERWIDGEALVNTLIEKYDIEDTQVLRIVIREIDEAPVVARNWKEWWQMRMDVQGRRIEKRFKDLPIYKEKYEKRMEFISALIWLALILGAMGILQTVFYWMH